MLFRFCLTTHHSRTPASREFHILICTRVRKYSIRLLPNVSNKKNLKDERKEKKGMKVYQAATNTYKVSFHNSVPASLNANELLNMSFKSS